MGYKWKPSAAQRAAFAQRMTDPNERAEYEARKVARAEKKRAGSRFNYSTAGGIYIPTQAQYNAAMNHLHNAALTADQETACNEVILGYTSSMKIHHDWIHIVNELTRTKVN